MADTETIQVETRTGEALLPLLPALARLRSAVFRAWPYLYDGDEAYEVEYLRTYARSPRAAVVVALAAGAPVGAAPCIPLADEGKNVLSPFLARGLDPARFFYFGESVLLPELRGRGIGVRFFEAREAHARAASDAEFACFCGVERASDDPRRPPGFTPLDQFWRNRGYQPMPGMACTMRWREIGDSDETPHTLRFWGRALRNTSLP